MKKRARTSRKDWVVGRWQASNGQISTLFIVEKKGKGFRVRAVDESDDEELKVTKVKWTGNVLAFEALTPSNGWRTKNRLKMTSKSQAIHELTFWEPWKKVG